MNLPSRQIAMQSPRLFEEFRLAAARPERVREVMVVGSAYDSVLASDFTYVSTPITSGAALYRAMDAVGVSTLEELRRDKELFRSLVMDVNMAAAEKVAHAMLSFGGAVIAPAAFEARSLDWDQDAYMGLWLDTIERKATRIAMVDGWEYSNGGAEEYLQALLMQAGRRDRNDIEIVDARGDVLMHADALMLLAAAVDDLATRGFEPVTLLRTLHRASVLHGMVEDEGKYGQLADRCGRTLFSVSHSYGAACARGNLRQAIRTARSQVAPAMHMLPESEIRITSSLDMAPGLLRQDSRQELSEARAKVLKAGDEDAGS